MLQSTPSRLQRTINAAKGIAGPVSAYSFIIRSEATMSDQKLTPDDLFRYYRRGMLDQDSLHTQILLTLIDLAVTQQAHTSLLELTAEDLSKLDLDVETIARYLHLIRPSQARRDQGLRADQNGATGPAAEDDEADPPDEADQD
jgi:hypothetical protein